MKRKHNVKLILASIIILSLSGCSETEVVLESVQESTSVNNTVDNSISSANRLEKLNESPITSEDIVNIAKELNLNNWGNASSELIKESLLITYDNESNITRCSNRTSKLYKRAEDEYDFNISSLDIFTEYGKNELGYDTLTHIEFSADKLMAEKLKSYLVKCTYENIDKLILSDNDIKYLDKTLNFNNGIIKITESSRANSESMNLKMNIYYNLGILNDSYVNTDELVKYEPLIKNSTFETLENFKQVSKVNKDIVLTLDESEEFKKECRIDTVSINRDWVRKEEKSKEFEIYNTSKEYIVKSNDKRYKIKFNVDVYDRFNLHRMHYLTVASETLDESRNLMSKLTSIGVDEMQSMLPDEKYKLSDNESVSLTKTTEDKDNFIWYIAYAIYDK